MGLMFDELPKSREVGKKGKWIDSAIRILISSKFG